MRTRAIHARQACAIAVVAAIWTTAASAGTLEQQCLEKRVKALTTFLSCVQRCIGRCSPGAGNCDLHQLSRCQIAYSKVWPRLQTLRGTTCAQPRFEDNGDGTVTDHLTTLVWEKKSPKVPESSWTEQFTWSAADGDGSDEDGTLFATYLATLNSLGFGGANGWRLPTLAELLSLTNQSYTCAAHPCFDEMFDPFIGSNDFYWSATGISGNPDGAWGVEFRHGSVVNAHKSSSALAWAVRGGL